MGQLGHQVLLWLQQQDVTPRLLRSATPLLDQVSWPDDLDVSTAGENNHYESTVCEAFCAIAETGSLVMLSSSSSPTLLNFLPDNFICVVQRQRIVQHIEDVWDRVRMEPDGMPRAINIITGPSRTADVEQTIQLGAHGPRKLHVILYS